MILTDDQIRDCAKEAGFDWHAHWGDDEVNRLTKFAELILSAAAANAPAGEAAPDTSQEWAKLDGASAFQLIERHADDWEEAGRMMESWRIARQAPDSKPAEVGDGQ